MFTLMGHGIGTDIIIAKAWINMYFAGSEIRYAEISEFEITSEIARLRRAIKMLDEDFEEISTSLKDAKTGDFDNLLDSHRLIVNDPLLVVETEKRILAPVNASEKAGTLKVLDSEGNLLAEADLIYLENVEELGFFQRLWAIFWDWLVSLFS